jgi:Holliday junction DNA helicase RuvA
VQLFGFATERERFLFLDLLKVDGVGPKGAQKILSALNPEQLEAALDTGDLGKLEKVSGIGKKTAQKMLLTLKGKLTFSETGAGSPSRAANPAAEPWQDIITGLTNMGYDRKEAEGTVVKLAADLGGTDTAFAALPKSAQEETLLRRAIVALASKK